MRDRSSRRAVLALSGAVVLAGCYQYVPRSLDAMPIGARVRAQLSSEAELAFRDSLGIDARVVKGTLVDRNPQRVLLEVRTASGAPAFGERSLYQRVAVTPQDVLRVEFRELNRGKTSVLAVAMAGVAAFVIVELVGRNRPGAPDPSGGPPPERRVRW